MRCTACGCLPPEPTRGRSAPPRRKSTALVRKLRDSISVTVGGVNATYPFDVDAARTLFDAVMGPVAGDLAGRQAPGVRARRRADGVAAPSCWSPIRRASTPITRRVAEGGDEYDFRGHRLARPRPRDQHGAVARQLPRCAPGARLDRGAALPRPGPEPARRPDRARHRWCAARTAGPMPAATCRWRRGTGRSRPTSWSSPAASWARTRSALITGAAFTDTAIEQRSDLDNYRIVHFATHGIVTAPHAGCPARPGAADLVRRAKDSDGLLQFGEIFDLKLDADLVILSACNTASLAGLEATQRGGHRRRRRPGARRAGARVHRRRRAAGDRQPLAGARRIRRDQAPVRDASSPPRGRRRPATRCWPPQTRADGRSADTSHPFYWAGFALIGDGERPLFHGN